MDNHLLLASVAAGASAGALANYALVRFAARALPTLIRVRTPALAQQLSESVPAKLDTALSDPTMRARVAEAVSSQLARLEDGLVVTSQGTRVHVSLDRLNAYLAGHAVAWLLSDEMRDRIAAWFFKVYRENYDATLRDLLPGFVTEVLHRGAVFAGQLPAANAHLVGLFLDRLATDRRLVSEILDETTAANLLHLYDLGALHVRKDIVPLVHDEKVQNVAVKLYKRLFTWLSIQSGAGAWVARRVMWWKGIPRPEEAEEWFAKPENRRQLTDPANAFITETIEGETRKDFERWLQGMRQRRISEVVALVPEPTRQAIQAHLEALLRDRKLGAVITRALQVEGDLLLNRTVGFYLDDLRGWRKKGEPYEDAIRRLCTALFDHLRSSDVRPHLTAFVQRLLRGFAESLDDGLDKAQDCERVERIARAATDRVLESVRGVIVPRLGALDYQAVTDHVARLTEDVLAGGRARAMAGYGALAGAAVGALVALAVGVVIQIWR